MLSLLLNTISFFSYIFIYFYLKLQNKFFLKKRKEKKNPKKKHSTLTLTLTFPFSTTSSPRSHPMALNPHHLPPLMSTLTNLLFLLLLLLSLSLTIKVTLFDPLFWVASLGFVMLDRVLCSQVWALCYWGRGTSGTRS